MIKYYLSISKQGENTIPSSSYRHVDNGAFHGSKEVMVNYKKRSRIKTIKQSTKGILEFGSKLSSTPTIYVQ